MDKRIVAFALFACLLVVSAPPLSATQATTNTALGSEHTTASDFQNGTLSNAQIVGSGSTAYITAKKGLFEETWEDADQSDYTTSDDSNGQEYYFDSQTTDTIVGSTAVEQHLRGAGGNALWSETKALNRNVDPNDPLLFTAWFKAVDRFNRNTGYDSSAEIRVTIKQSNGATQRLDYRVVNDDGSTSANDGNSDLYFVAADHNSGAWTQLDRDINADLQSKGYANATEVVSVSFFIRTPGTGGGEDELLVRYDDYQLAEGGSGVGVYQSDIHDVSDPTTGDVDLSLTNASADVTWQARTGGTWSNVTSATYTTSGTKTVDLSTTSADLWRVLVELDASTTDALAELDSDSVRFTNHAPTLSAASPNGTTTGDGTVELSAFVDDQEFASAQGESVTVEAFVDDQSVGTETVTQAREVTFTATELGDGTHTWRYELDDSYGGSTTGPTNTFEVTHGPPIADEAGVSPTDGAGATSRDVTLSVPVVDPDFADIDGETVTAEFYLDGTQVGSDTLTANGTAATTTTVDTGGTHNWFVDLTSTKGGNTTSSTFSFQTPGELTIRSATDGDQVLTSVDIELKFYQEGEERVYERSVSDGTVDLTGLPVGSQFTVTSGSEQFHFRRAVIESIYQQKSLYLLNTSADTASIRFQLDDSTGRFPSAETTLFVDRAINQSGTTQFKTVAGGGLGASASFQTYLENDQVYRLRVKNAQNETRLLGTYVPDGDGPAPLPIGRVRLQGESLNASAAVSQARIDTVNVDGNETRKLRVLYFDGADATSELTIYVYERGNESNVLVANATQSGPFGYFVATYDVPDSAPDDVSYVVEVSADRGDLGTFEETNYAGEVGELAYKWGMDPQVLSLITWVGIVALTGLVVIVDSRAAALVAVVLTAFGTMVGAIHPPGVAVGLAGGVAVLANLTR